jgi:hypothetical protein
MGKVYKFTRTQLKTKRASRFKQGDAIRVGKYMIHISYGPYSAPSMMSMVEDFSTGRILDVTPGVSGSRPYYIDDFLHR